MRATIDRVRTEAESPNVDIEALSAKVQEFYARLRNRLETHAYYQGTLVYYTKRPLESIIFLPLVLTQNERESILELGEKYVCINVFGVLFCPAASDDEQKDLALQTKIRRLNWIGTKELGCSISEASQEVRDLLHEAINGTRIVRYL